MNRIPFCTLLLVLALGICAGIFYQHKDSFYPFNKYVTTSSGVK